MATTVTISDEAKAYADELVRRGCYDSFDQAVEAGLLRLRIDGEHDDLTEEEWESVEAALAEVDAGGGLTAEEVFEPLLAKYRAMAGGA